jgi:hypothetical protein
VPIGEQQLHRAAAAGLCQDMPCPDSMRPAAKPNRPYDASTNDRQAAVDTGIRRDGAFKAIVPVAAVRTDSESCPIAGSASKRPANASQLKCLSGELAISRPY